MRGTVVGRVEVLLTVCQDHILILAILAFVIHWTVLRIVVSRKKVKLVRQEADVQINVPRVYLSDSNWFERCTDVFRTFSRGFEIMVKGYQMVLVLNGARRYVVSQRDFQSQICRRVVRDSGSRSHERILQRS